MEDKHCKDIEKALSEFKDMKKLCLTEPLDSAVILELNLNEDDCPNDREPKNRKNQCSEWCSPVPIFCIILIAILLGIGCLLLYSLMNKHIF